MGQISSGILKVEMPDGQPGYVSFGWLDKFAFRHDIREFLGYKPGKSQTKIEIEHVWMRAIPHGWEICEPPVDHDQLCPDMEHGSCICSKEEKYEMERTQREKIQATVGRFA